MPTRIGAVLLLSVVLTQTHCGYTSEDSLLSLFLTPYLERGHIKEAQELSRVYGLTEDWDDVESYSGYFTVNKTYGSNIFFWFFPAETNPAKAPVLLWLNGGPSRTSVVGALLENGPYQVTEEGNIERRPISWTKSFSMLYMDNPVNAGYSFTLNETGMSTTTEDTAVNLYSALVQMFKLFPQYSKNNFYIGGQSYAGKYVPVLGRYIHDRNTDTNHAPEVHINFKGIYLGAGYCDPENMMPAFPDYLFTYGRITDSYREEMRSAFIKLIADTFSGKRAKMNVRGYISTFFGTSMPSMDHLLGREYTNHRFMKPLKIFMESWVGRVNLHAGFSKPDHLLVWDRVANKLSDFLTSTSPENAFLMNNYKVLHYSGNLDVIVNVPMTEAFLHNVDWDGQADYRAAHRSPWRLDDQLMGWVATVRNFTRVVIRNSGHMVPYDQPKAAFEMMNRFIFDRPFETPTPSPPCDFDFCNRDFDTAQHMPILLG